MGFPTFKGRNLNLFPAPITQLVSSLVATIVQDLLDGLVQTLIIDSAWSFAVPYTIGISLYSFLRVLNKVSVS